LHKAGNGGRPYAGVAAGFAWRGLVGGISTAKRLMGWLGLWPIRLPVPPTRGGGTMRVEGGSRKKLRDTSVSAFFVDLVSVAVGER